MTISGRNRHQEHFANSFANVFGGCPSQPVADPLPKPPPRPDGSEKFPQGEGELNFQSRKKGVRESNTLSSGPLATGFVKSEQEIPNFLETSKRRVSQPTLRDNHGNQIAYHPDHINTRGEAHALPQEHPSVEAYVQNKTMRAVVAPPDPYYHDANHSWTLGLEHDTDGNSPNAASSVPGSRRHAGLVSGHHGDYSPVTQSCMTDAASSVEHLHPEISSPSVAAGRPQAPSLRMLSPESRASMRANEPSKEVPRIGAISRSSRPMTKPLPNAAQQASIQGPGILIEDSAKLSESHVEPIHLLDPDTLSAPAQCRAKVQHLLKGHGVAGLMTHKNEPDKNEDEEDEEEEGEGEEKCEGQNASPRMRDEFLAVGHDEASKNFPHWEKVGAKHLPKSHGPPATFSNIRQGDDEDYLKFIGHRVRAKPNPNYDHTQGDHIPGGMPSQDLSVKDAPPYFFDTGDIQNNRKKRGYAWDAHSQMSLPGTTLNDPVQKDITTGELVHEEFKNVHGRRAAGGYNTNSRRTSIID